MMQRVTRAGLALSLLFYGCVSDGGGSTGTRAIDQDRGSAQQTPSIPLSLTDGGGPGPSFNSVIANGTGAPPKDAGLGGLDAGSGTGGPMAVSDAGNDAAANAPFACEANSDCQIKNIFSCCGYFPRCANTAANFAPPDCSQGQIGVCSLPLIDHCECRQQACVDVQTATLN